MKKLLALPLLALLAFPACQTTLPVLTDMPVAEFDALKTRVNVATALVSSRISVDWDQAKRNKALNLIDQAQAVVEANDFSQLGATNVLRALVDRYGDALGLDDQAKRDVRDAALLIELIVGPINIDINASIEPREQELILTFLDGLEVGLQ
tara:strand:- start:84 stop:539 length:456 start_codon:yes stop_codon:yes gene_type:complete